MHDTNFPPTKRAYTFCTKTREYLGELEAYLSPLEGTYPLPSNATFVEPGSNPGPLKARRLAQDGSTWEAVDDFRYIMLWDTKTALPVPNTLALGNMLPPGITCITPPTYSSQDCKCAAWDEGQGAWVAAPDYSRYPLWVKATAERAPSLPAGVELPDTLTTLPPPTSDHADAVWNEATSTWMLVSYDAPP
ncbi:phage tail protein [Dyella sp.]|uniref:phage tail protein n=1 Tax=Dyella sp. TaxID=1869338 RepID=UPI002B471F66|nr:phage tail protein [Dyella sp.]HKT28759.1 phage tail protein [Dyella sp.]